MLEQVDEDLDQKEVMMTIRELKKFLNKDKMKEIDAEGEGGNATPAGQFGGSFDAKEHLPINIVQPAVEAVPQGEATSIDALVIDAKANKPDDPETNRDNEQNQIELQNAAPIPESQIKEN